MPCIIHSTVSFETFTHAVADQIENSFTFAGNMTVNDTIEVAHNMIVDFYNGVGPTPASSSVGAFLSPVIDRSMPAVIKHYVLSGVSSTVPLAIGPGVGTGAPLRSTTFTLGASVVTTALPNQVAVCYSYHGTMVGASEHDGPGPRPAERRRGRIFLGPLNTGALAIDPAQHDPVVSIDLINSIRASALNMLREGNLPSGSVVFRPTDLPVLTVPDARAVPVIWSRKDTLVRQIAYGFVDNRFDTQRRRLEPATFRMSWTGADVA